MRVCRGRCAASCSAPACGTTWRSRVASGPAPADLADADAGLRRRAGRCRIASRGWRARRMRETFDAGWLELREPFDHAACSRTLGTGSRRCRRQDRACSISAREPAACFACWPQSSDAPRPGRSWTRTKTCSARHSARSRLGARRKAGRRPGRVALFYFTRPRVRGASKAWWRIWRRPRPGLPLAHADAVVCSALLDLVSAAWLQRLAPALRVPFLACLSIDGRDAWLPRDPVDAVVRAGSRRDQMQDKGFGPALGIGAAAAASRVFAASGFCIRSAPSDWLGSRGTGGDRSWNSFGAPLRPPAPRDPRAA